MESRLPARFCSVVFGGAQRTQQEPVLKALITSFAEIDRSCVVGSSDTGGWTAQVPAQVPQPLPGVCL